MTIKLYSLTMHLSVELVSGPVDKLAECRNSSSIFLIDLVLNIMVHSDALRSIMNILIAGDSNTTHFVSFWLL